jgi:hypothetical protein
MLGVRNYPREYVDSCRAKVDADVAAYRGLAAIARKQPGSNPALETFEAAFFNNMVLVLDACFVHRLRAVEGKDGNPLNEVRLLCQSLLEHGGVMTVDKSIKLAPEKSLLGYRAGDPIRVGEEHFARICNAYFAEIESRFL